MTAGKLIGAWCLLMLSWPVAIFWISPDVSNGQGVATTMKIGVVLAVTSASALLFTYSLARNWALPTRRFEAFIAALPSSETDLPDGGPPELQSLSRAMKAMAERVREV